MIHIKDSYYIDADSAQFVLTEKATVQEGPNAGKEVFRPIGYFSSVPAALNGYIKIISRENVSQNDYSLSEAVQMFRDTENEMRRLFEPFTAKEAS